MTAFLSLLLQGLIDTPRTLYTWIVFASTSPWGITLMVMVMVLGVALFASSLSTAPLDKDDLDMTSTRG